MRDYSTDPSRAAPLRRIAILGVLFVAGILSCGKDVTGPLSSAARYVRDFAWTPVFPPAYQLAGGAGSGVVAFDHVHLVLHHDDGSVALDTTVSFPAGTDELTLSLTIKLLDNAPTAGEPMSLDLGYLDGAGNVVFKGGPISVVVAPPPPGSKTNPPVQVPVTYTGPGSNAATVAISTKAVTTVAGSNFQFSAIAKDNNGAAIAGTPIVWSSLDPSLATITSAAAGNGVAQNLRGTARIVAQLLTGPADTALLTITLPASQLIAQSGNTQTGVVGTALALPLVVKTAASDGVPVAGVTVSFAVATGGGSVANATVVSDANGLAQTTWKLGTGTGAQSVTATSGTLTNSPLTFTATASAATATKLVNTTPPANGVAGAPLGPIVFSAEDNNGNVATGFTGPVVISLSTTVAGAALTGTTSVNAVLGVATFSTLTINKNGTGYTLVAASTLPNDTTAAFNIAVGSPNKLVFTVQPTTTTTGNVINPAIVVNAEDSQGNLTPSFTSPVTLTFATNPSSATLGGTATATAVLGVATFSGISVSAAGVGYSLSAAATGVTSATSSLFNVSSGVATNLVLSSGGAQTSSINTALAAPVSVMVTDAGSNPVAGKTVNFAVLTGGGSVLPTSGVSNASGIVQTSWTLGALVGVQSISATSAGLAGSPLTITATGIIAGAFSKTWTGATNNQWTTATNWSPAGVPAATDSISIPVTANNPQISASTTVGGLTVQAGATLTLTSAAVTLTDNGAFDATGGILGAGNVNMSAIVGRPIKGVVTAANVTITSTYSLNAAFTVIGNVTIGTGGLLNVNGNVLTISGTFATTGSGVLQMGSAADGMTVNGNVSFGGGSESGQLTNGLLTVTGSFVQTGGTTSFAAGALHQVVFGGTSAQTVNIASPGTATFGKFTTANTAGVTIQTNVVTLSDVTAGGPLAGATSGLTIAGQLIDPSGNTTVAAVSFSGSANPIAASTPTVNTNITFNSSATLLGNVTVNGGVNVNSAVGVLVLNGHTLTVNGSLNVQNSATVTMNNAADALTVNGSATFAGGVNNLSAGLLTITGNFTQSTTTTSFTPTAAHKTRFTGVSPTISFANPTTSWFGRLEIASIPTAGYTFSSDVQTTGDVWLKTGGVLTLTNGGHTFSIAGGLYDSTGGRWQATNTVFFATNPALPKTINTNATFSGIVALSDSLKFTGAANNLTINSGSFTLNGHKVRVTGAFATTGGGVLVMQNAADSLIVKGSASFTGGATTGLLNNGYLEVDGSNFFQGTNTQAFAADAPHITWFWGNLAQTITFANPGTVGASHFGNMYLQDTATVLTSPIFLNGEFETGGQSSFHVHAASDQLITSDGADMRNVVFDNVRWKLSGTNGNGHFPSLDNVTFQNISATTQPQFDWEYTVTTNLSMPGFTFLTTPTGGGVYVKVAGPDTLAFPGISPASNGGYVGLFGGGAITGWSNLSTWTGAATTTAWNTAGNWSPAVVPTAASDVVIGSSIYQPATGGAVTMHSLTVNTGMTLSVTGGNMSVNGDITVQPGAAVAINASTFGVLAYGNVTTDTAGTTGFTVCAGPSSGAVNLQSGSAHTITGKFCNLSNFGTYTASGPIQVVGSLGTGGLNEASGSSLTFNGNRVDVYSYGASVTGTITMQNASDMLFIHGGTALFQGGSETGLMTAGTIYDRSPNFIINGTGYDASGGSQTVVVDTSFFQTLTQNTAATPGHGFNNVTMKGTASKGFSGDQWITGTLLFDPTMVGPGNVSGSYNIHVNTLVDNSTGISGGAFQGSTALHITGSTPFNRDTLIVNTVYFDHGQTFALSHNLITHYIVVDSNSTLSLNGHRVDAQGNYFTTQNGGMLSMTNAADSLIANQFYFNGGSTLGLLTNGGINVTGAVFGTLYQGYTSAHVAAVGTSPYSFAPSGTRVWLNPSSVTNVEFANPGSGATGSHFWFVQAGNANPVSALSNVVVDSLLKGEVSGATWQSDSAAQNVARTIIAAGIYNSGTYGLSLKAMYLFLNDGVATSSINNVTWSNFPTVSSGALFTQDRTSNPPSLNFLTYTGTTFSGTGQFVSNVGSSLLTLGSSITPSTCASGVYSNGQGCH